MENQLEAVISLPSGVFKPYAGVKTAILIFTKGGKTDNVWFYDIEDDGFSLDDKRDKLYDNDFAGDLPSCLKEWNKRSEDEGNDRSQKYFTVPVDELIENRYDLSIGRYQEQNYETEKFESPGVILEKINLLNVQVNEGLKDIENLLD